MTEYLYDGSFNGLLTAVFYAYSKKDKALINHQKHYIPSLLTEPIWVATEDDKANRVATSIYTKLSPDTFQNIHNLYLSDTPECAQLILEYVQLCYRYGDSINLAKNNDTIIKVDTLARKVTHESHRFTGFVRFKEIAPMCFYSAIEPDHHILPLLADHFTTRFSDQHFVIHDTKRHIALVYNQKEAFLQELTPEENLSLSSVHYVDQFEELFKAFYTSTTIAARLNPKLQKRFMPVRYWKNLVEL